MGDPATPQHVVAEVQAPGTDLGAGQVPGGGVPLLVDVVVDDVELAVGRLQGPDGVLDQEAATVPEPGTGQEVFSLPGISGVGVGEVHLPRLPHRPGEPVGGEAEAGAHLEHAAGTYGAGQQLEGDADHPADNGEVAILGQLLHLQEHRLVVAVAELAHVGRHGLVDELHAGESPTLQPRQTTRSRGYQTRLVRLSTVEWNRLPRGLRGRRRHHGNVAKREEEGGAMPDVPAVRERGVRKRYGTTVALDGIDLTVDHGEVFGLLGPNGAGKTTFCEILEGHRLRDEGEIEVLGYDPADGRQEFKDRIGVVLQE